jgi:hypothetical protein
MPPAVAGRRRVVDVDEDLPSSRTIFKECLKMQNKTGMYHGHATQYPGIEEFNNDMAMRQPLTAGNLLAYRNTATA